MAVDGERPPNEGEVGRGVPPESPADRAWWMDRLREANEQLVVSAMRAQELADEARAARAEAEAANRLKDEFIAVVSHELRTPLSAVLGWARLLAGRQLDAERTSQAVHAIDRNAVALARIVDDLLDLCRILDGGIRIDPAPVDLVAVVQEAIEELQPAAEAKGLRVRLTSVEVPGPVAADALRLQQVVSNLLSNAIKFTPDEGGDVEVRVTQFGTEVEIQVADTGRGIDPAFLPHIFERFTQADPSTTRRQGGLGIGLAIVRALVERHGGTVRAESAGAGQGATFTLRLPVLAGREAPVGRDTAAASPAPVRLDGICVLLVEDDADGRQVLTTVLELVGATVTAVHSAREALKALDSTRPDVIVSDIGMPDEDGFTLIRRVRGQELGAGLHPVPAIALTGYVSPDDRDRMLAAGFQTHVRKPVEPDDLVAAVAALAFAGSR